MFSNQDPSMFNYEVCELSKNHQVSFSPRVIRDLKLLSTWCIVVFGVLMVHSDVWGPSRVKYLSWFK